jgi:hypothetical protein
VQNAAALQVDQGGQQIAQYSCNGVHWHQLQVLERAVNVSVAKVRLQRHATIILNEVNGRVSGVGLARHAVWRHVLVQQPRYVGVLQLPQEPGLPHHEFERLLVDVHALDDAGARCTGACLGGGVGYAESGAE